MKVCFADQNSQPLKIEDRINLTLVIKQNVRETRFHHIKMRYLIEPRERIYVKGYGFCHLRKTWVRI